MTKRNRQDLEVEEAEQMQLIEAQHAAAESHFWLQAAMEIQSTLTSVYNHGATSPAHDA